MNFGRDYKIRFIERDCDADWRISVALKLTWGQRPLALRSLEVSGLIKGNLRKGKKNELLDETSLTKLARPETSNNLL